jgi:hypothetical protein
MNEDLMEATKKLDADLRQAARGLTKSSARRLVDFYYQIQDFRTHAANQVRLATENDPNRVLAWVLKNTTAIENNIKRALDEFTEEYRIGRWMKSLVGIGPVISAGMLAHLDISRANTASRFWNFAGLNPSIVWEKGKKRPWNADLKCLCYKMSDCFMKFHNHKDKDGEPDCFYGLLYVKRKEQEVRRNARGEFKEQAAAILETKNFRRDTTAKAKYSEGFLPDGHVHARACRYTSKMFLSHLHHVMHCDYYGMAPPVPYILGNGNNGHSHFIPPPNWPFEEGTGKSLKEMVD